MDFQLYKVNRCPNLLQFARIIIVVTLELLIHALVYYTGGTASSLPQLCHIPIVLAAYYWGKWGGFTVAFITGIFMGPAMPKDVTNHVMQDPVNWIVRLVIFVIIGFVAGYIFEKSKRSNFEKIEAARINPLTGLPNENLLIMKIQGLIQLNKQMTVVMFAFENISDISKYVSYHVVGDTVKHICAIFKESFGHENVFALNDNEYVVLAEFEVKDIVLNKAKELIESFNRNPLEINGYIYSICLKSGLYQSVATDVDPFEIIGKARSACDNGDSYSANINQYDDKFDSKNRLMHEIAGSILKAIDNGELFLVYQPKISLVEKRISGVEVLVRWNRGSKTPVGPNIFVPVAEDIGYITEISRWIITTALKQLKEWQNQGILINLAINFTTKEVADDSLKNYALDLIDSYDFCKCNFEIEITERVFAHNKQKAIETLSAARKLGFKVSIDDYGTGYNSLMSAAELPFDLIKIDKYFIDRLNQNEILEMVKSIISFVHGIGKEVVAEGVETKEQLEILASLDCDKIQGYYYSKPLQPDDFKAYYVNFSFDDYQ